MRSETAKRALKSTNQRLHQSTSHKNHVFKYRYNEYMAHHYAYMTKVAKICEPKSYAKAAKDAK